MYSEDLLASEVNVIAAAQEPIIGSVFGASASEAAWKKTPSWYLVALQDQAPNLELQLFYARRAGATTAESTRRATRCSFPVPTTWFASSNTRRAPRSEAPRSCRAFAPSCSPKEGWRLLLYLDWTAHPWLTIRYQSLWPAWISHTVADTIVDSLFKA